MHLELDFLVLKNILPQAISLKKWSSVSIKVNHTLALTTDGDIWAWGGFNNSGELGFSKERNSGVYINSVDPTFRQKWKAISAGFSHALAIDTEGQDMDVGREFFWRTGHHSK